MSDSDHDAPDAGFEDLRTPAPRARRGRLYASIAAVAVLAAGGTATYVAFAAGSTGSGSPQAAVQHVLDDLHNADLIGVLDDLAPGERSALAGPIQSDIASLKRLGVLSSAADPSVVGGFSFSAGELTFGPTITVNDHVRLVQITGGSIAGSADAAKLPLTQRLLGMVSHDSPEVTRHRKITEPVRIAAEEVGGRWYASLFYTEADEMAAHQLPTAADAIPARGAASPSAAVETMVRSLIGGKARRALALISPDELGAVHDYGAMILAHLPGQSTVPVGITKLATSTTALSGGVEQVKIDNVTLVSGGKQVTVALSNGCVQVMTGGDHQTICAASALTKITQVLGAFCTSTFSATGTGAGIGEYFGGAGSASVGARSSSQGRVSASHGGLYTSTKNVPAALCTGPKFTAGQQRALTHLLTGLLSLGIDTTQVEGSWYIAPVRTLADNGASLLAALQGDDIFQLASLGN